MTVRFVRPRERDVQRAVMAACAAHGVAIYRRNTGAMRNSAGRLVRFGRRGDTDLYGVVAVGPRRGMAVYVEVKQPGKRPTVDQVSRLMEMNIAGAIAFWVDDAEECSRVLDRVLRDGCCVKVYPDGSQEIFDG